MSLGSVKELQRAIEVIRALIEAIGDAKLSDAQSWLAVEENARRLREEGHEDRIQR